MNRNQKIAVAVGVVLVVLSGLFPPYEGVFATKGDNLRRHLGRHFLFAPPTPEYVHKAIFGPKAQSTPTDSFSGKVIAVAERIYLAHFRSRVVLSEVVVQFSIVLIATAAAALLLTKRRT